MVPRKHFELLRSNDDQVLGFKLTGTARSGTGMCRVWLRRGEPWNRYLDPRIRSADWDVRLFVATDSAFALQQEFTLRDLDTLDADYAFPEQPAEAAGLALNADPVHDLVVRWAAKTLGLPEPTAARPAPKPAPAPAPRPAAPVAAAPAPKPAEPTPAPTPAEPAAARPAVASSGFTAALEPIVGPPPAAATAETARPAEATKPAEPAAARPAVASSGFTAALEPIIGPPPAAATAETAKPAAPSFDDDWAEAEEAAVRVSGAYRTVGDGEKS